MAIVETTPGEQHFRLAGLERSAYEHLLQAFEGRPIRLTYDGGEVEIMTVSPEQERAKTIMARLVEALTEELDVPICGLGNTTFRHEGAGCGLEPDEAWFIGPEATIRSKRAIDMTVDPPPDLVAEIEISRSALDRMQVYAQLRVPEVWRYDGRQLRVCLLQKDNSYADSESSSALPQLRRVDLEQFLNQRDETDDTSLLRSFRKWVRENLLSNGNRKAEKTNHG